MMWKRMLISFIALIGSFTVGYAYYNQMIEASSATDDLGGSLTGRVNIAPSNLSGSKTNIGLKKGDRYYLGKNGSAFVGWQLLTADIMGGTVAEDSWFAMTTEPIQVEPAFDTVPKYYAYDTIDTKVDVNGSPVNGALAPFDESNVSNTLNNFNMQWNEKYNDLIGTYLPDKTVNTHEYLKTVFSNTNTRYLYTMVAEYIRTGTFGKNAFIPHVYDMLLYSPAVSISGNRSTPAFTLSFADKKFSSQGQTYHYFSHEFYVHSHDSRINSVAAFNGGTGGDYYESNTITQPLAVRPAIFIQKNNIVFGLSGSEKATDGLSSVTAPKLQNGYSNITTDAIGDTMKIRYHDATMSVTLDSLLNEKGEELKKNANGYAMTEGSKVQVKAVGNNVYSNSTVSALIFNSNGDFINYQKLGGATGNLESYMLDISSLKTGNYQIAVVNEVYDSTDYDAAKSSLISDVKHLTVVDALSDLKFTAKQDLEYEKNVNVGDNVGVISSSNGVETVVYQLSEDPLYPGENANLEIDSDGKSVIVKNNALHAGTYHFKIQAQDGNHQPIPPLEILATITVKKVNASVAFDDPNQTKKSIAQATAGWSETASTNPSTGTKITYTKSGGSVGLINIDPHTGAITYTGNGGYGKVTIKATADDDPTSGYDNYNPADTTKEIVIYREVDGSVTPHANSSDTTIPTFQTSDANVKPNGIIGTIKGTLGTPDNGTSGTTTYTYGIKNVDDSNYFSVNASTGEIKTTADLSTNTGTYHITVTVSDKWSTKEIPVTISVGLAPAENLKFYENSTSNTVINTKTVNFTDTNVSVYASVKGSTNTNPVTYKIQDGSTNVIEVNPNSGAITIRGVGTVIIVAEKQGASGQADAQATLTFTVNAVSQSFIYTTDSTLQTEMPKNGNNYKTYTETYAPSKTFQLYTAGYPSGSTVTYQLKTGSPSDVISVDSNGLVHILNASMNSQKGNVIVQATSHDPSGNYVDKTIELPIDIDKGTRVIAFEKNPITVVNGTGSITPNMLTDGVLDTEGNTMIEIDPSEDHSIAWTNDGETIQYSWNDASGKDIKLHATKSADRNYKEAKAEGTLHILGADEASLTITTPGRIIYGDHFTIRSTQDDSMSTNVQYTFEADNQVFISAPQVNGNKAEFDAIGNSGSTEITIKVTRTADGELPLTKSVKIKVLPKPITIEIEDKTKKRLEENPTLTIKDISHELVSWNGVKDNVDTSVIQLSTTAGKYSPIGSYPITSKNYTTLNDNYPNYIFTIKEGLLNVIDNGNKDFWDVDDDGCPDLNIQIKDEEGNDITINGDVNEDGIPDYNIDSNGDGKPDLNIDTDSDGKPDLNLVILKEWKPSKCVTLGDIQYSSGITAKPEINIDTDGDLIPDIDIDTKGDFKPHLNISKDGKTPSVNIATIESWKPDQDFKYQGFVYDSIEHKPYLNIDTDGDGRPDVNIDLDGDGSADINVDVDGDLIPDVDIDSTGDGKPDINIDTDGDGKADENLMDITEWKPEHNVNKPFEYDTMKIEHKKELEDNGVTVEKPDGGAFLPNMAIKVTDVTEEKKEEVKSSTTNLINENQEVKQVFEIKLLENGREVQPDGVLKIRIPIKNDVKNPILFRQKEDGSYERVNAIIEDGYLVYESDELGIVSIIGDLSSEIQGNYYPGDHTGGALTGDHTNIMLHVSVMCFSIAILYYLRFKGKRITKR